MGVAGGAGRNNNGDLTEELKKLNKEIAKLNQNFAGQFKNLSNALQKYRTQTEESKNPYQDYINKERKKRETMSASASENVKKYGDDMGVYKWYREQQELINNNTKMTPKEKADAMDSLDEMKSMKDRENSEKYLNEQAGKIGKIFSSTLDDVLLDFGNFDKNMKNMSKQLSNYLIKEGVNIMGKVVFSPQNRDKVGNFLQNSNAGPVGKAGNALYNVGHVLGFWHSGGIIPSGANYSLPGTQEQLAILKGGERVLSPGENVQYESGRGSNPVMFNNFNVKAWDSKDVSKYLLENQDLLNAITFRGIKDNNMRLRNIVRNA